MKDCPKCGGWIFDDKPCGCRKFEVFYPEQYGDEWKVVRDFSMEGVAEKIAEQINSDDPLFDEDIFETPIIVKDENGVEKSFNATATVDIHYSIKEITDE